MEFFTEENTKMLFYFLEKCKGVEQNSKWHPEGDVFTHALQVGSLAFRESNDVDVIIAAYLHDVGKMVLSKEHVRIGCVLLYPYVSVKTLFLIEHHMRIHTYLNGEMKKLSKCKFFEGHVWFSDLVQLSRWDRMGRNPNRKVSYDKFKIIDRLNRCVDKHFNVPKYLLDYTEGLYGIEDGKIESQKRIPEK